MRFMFEPRPAPKWATPDDLAKRYYATAHRQTFCGASSQEVMDQIDAFEEAHDLRAASYIVNDAFEGLTDKDDPALAFGKVG
jgi:hypothetical protein